MAVTTLDRAKVAIVTQHPFFGSILLKRKIITDDPNVSTLAVDQRGQIYLNPEFVEKLSVDQLVFGLCHEVGHVIGQHASRVGHRNRENWNIAGDAWINDMLKAAGVGEFIEGGVDMPGSKDKTVDEIYNNLPPPQDGSGPGGLGDDLIQRGAPMDADEANRVDAETRVEVAQAAQAAKAQGKMPGALAKIIADMIDPGTPWYEVLERYMVAFTRGDYTWSRPNRRFNPHYLPSIGQIAQMGEVVVQVDVSGSISKRELDYYNGHMKRIIELCNPSRVHVLYVDTGVCKHDVFEQGEPVELEFYSGGGTDMEAGFTYLDKEGIDPEVIVVLTDGYTHFSPTSPATCPVVWCISTNVTAPYGDNVHFEMERA